MGYMWEPYENGKQKQRPLNPPFVLKNISPSCLATPASKVRKTVTSSGFRSILPDELNDFLKEDELRFDDIQSLLSDNDDVIVFQLNKKSLHIRSKVYKLGVPLFILVIFNDYSFVANHNGTTCNISSLAVNKLKLIKTKSALFEAVRFLKNKESSLQSNILFEHLNAMRKVNVGEVLYTSDICRAYEYFAMQRSLYDCLCIDYKLPSIRTLTRLTSKISSMEDLSFINSILMNLNPLKRTSIILIDEVYVKASLLYQRGALFGQAVNYPEKLAKTILSFMIKCLFGGPEFICRAQPVANLSSEFQFA
ncbi:uncharacterized protein LOC136086082 [Hydra vulgaris]|uniref:Uncharacterized protein LOC136086082 n=1 Tax=Hydra vulgaris TaxID=6087 RepID=A0ABM4CRC7_HYDVU